MLGAAEIDQQKLLEATVKAATEAEQEDLREVAKAAVPAVVQRLLEGLMGQEYSVRMALNKRVALEVALVRVMHDAHAVQIDELITRLNEWRQAGMPHVPPAPERPRPVVPPLPPPAPPRPAAPPPVWWTARWR